MEIARAAFYLSMICVVLAPIAAISELSVHGWSTDVGLAVVLGVLCGLNAYLCYRWEKRLRRKYGRLSH